MTLALWPRRLGPWHHLPGDPSSGVREPWTATSNQRRGSVAFTLRDNKYFGKPKAEMTVTSEGLRPGKAVTSLSVPLAESVALMMSVSLSPGATQASHCPGSAPSSPQVRFLGGSRARRLTGLRRPREISKRLSFWQSLDWPSSGHVSTPALDGQWSGVRGRNVGLVFLSRNRRLDLGQREHSGNRADT